MPFNFLFLGTLASKFILEVWSKSPILWKKSKKSPNCVINRSNDFWQPSPMLYYCPKFVKEKNLVILVCKEPWEIFSSKQLVHL